MLKESPAHRMTPDLQPATPPVRPNGSLYRTIRRLIVFILGMSVLLVGVIMLIAPGPAFIVIPLGLAILATEFVWAKRILHQLKERLINATSNDNSTRWGRITTWLTNLFGRERTSRQSSPGPPVRKL